MDVLYFDGNTFWGYNGIGKNYDLIETKGGDYHAGTAVMVGDVNAWQHAFVARGYK